MANIEQFIPFLLKWEGEYVDDPADRGGATNKGVTLSTWKQQGYDKTGDGVIDVEDLKLLTDEEVVERILRPHYWNRWQADKIHSQSLANILVDWVWGSGRYGITIPQGILGIKQDGIVGVKTLHAVNSYPDREELFGKIKQARRAYFNMICIDRPKNRRFLKGWLNRLNALQWIPVIFLFCFFVSCKTVKTESHGLFIENIDSSRITSTQQVTSEIHKEFKVQNLNDHWLLENVTMYFEPNDSVDSSNSSPCLKKVSITRISNDRKLHSEQQSNLRMAGTEIHKEEQMIKVDRKEAFHTKRKEQTTAGNWVWWIIGGIVLVIGAKVYFSN